MEYDNRFEVEEGTRVHMGDILTDKAREQIKVGMVLKMNVLIGNREELRTLRVLKNNPKEGFIVEVIKPLMSIEQAGEEIARRNPQNAVRKDYKKPKGKKNGTTVERPKVDRNVDTPD